MFPSHLPLFFSLVGIANPNIHLAEGRYLSLRSPLLETISDTNSLLMGTAKGMWNVYKRKLQINKESGVLADYVVFQPDGKILEEVRHLVEKGAIKPDIDRIFDLREVAKAHEYMESHQAKGKVVLKVPQN